MPPDVVARARRAVINVYPPIFTIGTQRVTGGEVFEEAVHYSVGSAFRERYVQVVNECLENGVHGRGVPGGFRVDALLGHDDAHKKPEDFVG